MPIACYVDSHSALMRLGEIGVEDRHDAIALPDGQRTSGTEIVLNTDDEERSAGGHCPRTPIYAAVAPVCSLQRSPHELRSDPVGCVSRAIRLVFLAIGLTLVAILIWREGPSLVLAMLSRIGWKFALIAGIYTSYVLMRATALWRTMQDSAVPYLDVVRIRLSSEAVEVLTFTGPFLAEPAKGWLLTQRGVGTAASFAAVITEYLIYMAVSSSLSIFALLLILTERALPPAVRAAAVIVMVCTSGFLAAFLFAGVRGVGLITPTLRRLRFLIGGTAEWAAREFSAVEALVIDALHRRPARCIEVAVFDALAQALLIGEMRLITRTLGFWLSWGGAVTIEGGIKFVGTAFAFIPGQFGASEGVYTLLAGIVGLPTAAGLGVALVRRLRSVAVAAIGLLAVAISRHSPGLSANRSRLA